MALASKKAVVAGAEHIQLNVIRDGDVRLVSIKP